MEPEIRMVTVFKSGQVNEMMWVQSNYLSGNLAHDLKLDNAVRIDVEVIAGGFCYRSRYYRDPFVAAMHFPQYAGGWMRDILPPQVIR